jgi:hypothetical protein
VAFQNNAAGAFQSGLQIGVNGGATTGTLSIASGADVTAGTTNIATSGAGNTGTLTVNGASSTFALTGASSMTIGAASGTTGTLNVLAGGSFASGSGNVTIKPTGTVNVNGSTYQANGATTIDGGHLNFDATGVFTQQAATSVNVINGGASPRRAVFRSASAATRRSAS